MELWNPLGGSCLTCAVCGDMLHRQFCTSSPVGILLGCCWDFVGMTIQGPKIVGMDPNYLHPKPRPTTPQDLFESIIFLYQNEMF